MKHLYNSKLSVNSDSMNVIFSCNRKALMVAMAFACTVVSCGQMGPLTLPKSSADNQSINQQTLLLPE